MTNPPTSDGIDWSTTPVEMAREIKEQGERYLGAQLQVAVASDQRATTMASIFAAIATAVIAGAIAYWDRSGSGTVLTAGMIGGLWMMGGVAACLWAARPIDYFFPGNHPSQWYACREATPLAEALGGEAENYQERILSNAERTEKSSKALNLGTVLVCTAPLVAALAFWLSASFLPESRPASASSSQMQVYSEPAKAPTPPLISHPSTTSGSGAPATPR